MEARTPHEGADPDAPRPTFICVGAGKAGTTWLWDMLRQHPDVYLPGAKELHWFNEISYDGPDVRNPNHAKPLSWYLAFFSDARPGQVCGEISPSYLWSDTAPELIHRFDASMRILIMLRDPVERLFSSYLFGRQVGQIGAISFEESLARFPHLLERAPACGSVARYLELFGREQVHVVLYDDLVADPAGVLRGVQRFIGVREQVPPDVGSRRNVTGASRFPRTTMALMRGRMRLRKHGLEPLVDLGKRVGLVHVFRFFQGQVRPYERRPTVAPATEERLRRRFLGDVEGLERLLGVDLRSWKP
jgi:Sulfotransferase domain